MLSQVLQDFYNGVRQLLLIFPGSSRLCKAMEDETETVLLKMGLNGTVQMVEMFYGGLNPIVSSDIV